jgi:hypothetical protein
MQYMDKVKGKYLKLFEIKMAWWLVLIPSLRRWEFNLHHDQIKQRWMKGEEAKARGTSPINPIWIWFFAIFFTSCKFQT